MQISVIVPVYNGEETLRLCLGALADIDYDKNDYEIVVINDGSTDHTVQITSEFTALYSNFRLIDLGKNCGRVVARERGAREARFENLFFIDSRVIATKNTLQKIKEINYQPLMAGDLGDEKYRSDYDCLFYLIRRKIYFPYYPQSAENSKLWIDRDNFFKAPKGTTAFFINRELFLATSPETKDKDTNDDTTMMKNIIFERNIRILRDFELKATYLQRVNNDTASWLYQRGNRWADYYLFFINRYSLLHLGFTASLLTLLIYKPLLLPFIVIFLIAFVAAFLAQNSRDFVIVAKTAPLVLFWFYLGTLRGFGAKILKKVRS